ncbi:MAG: helix-turn-helix domain-containing protein [Alphaproteobacteria bacterium]|jgi:AcrR family transcriptional regulator|nr:helix-turn-helix domain-containing protein [Alphaproteobacteria bacterium]
MAKAEKSGRWQQRRRTRKDLLHAAGRLMKQGTKPTLEEIADEADVSRATAYRHFANVDALVLEAELDVAVPTANDVFGGMQSDDPAARLERVDTALHQMIADNEVQLRLMLANSLQQRAKGNSAGEMPVRQDRRTPLIEAALAPARARFKPADLEKLSAAMALIVGPEAMVVFRDVLRMDDAKAQKVRRWAIRALVDAATKNA